MTWIELSADATNSPYVWTTARPYSRDPYTKCAPILGCPCGEAGCPLCGPLPQPPEGE